MNAYKMPSLALLGLALVFSAGCFGSKQRLKVGSSAEGEVVEAEGLAPHNPDDIILTKRSSLVDAQKNAVERVVGVFVSAKTMVEKAIAIENNILARTEGYVRKYDIIDERVEDGLYKTRIRALVAFKDLEADLRDMSLLNSPELKRPRVLIKIKEQIGKGTVEEAPAAMSLESGLIEQGFVIVSEEREKDAEILIQGKGSAFPFQTEGLGGFVSYRARLSLQARRPGTKDVLVSLSKEASGLGGNAALAGLKALETVGELAAEEMATKITEAWAKGKHLMVFVENVKSFADADRVRKHLVAQPGINDLVLRVFDEEMAQFEVQLGSLEPTELGATLEASKSVPIKVLETSPQSLRCQLR